MMPSLRGSLRACLALLSVLLVGAGIDFESILHLHDDGRLELRAHELSLVEGAGTCGRTPHWDRSRSEMHEACLACMVSATALGRASIAARVAASPARRSRLEIAPTPRPLGTRCAPLGGRSPPHPPSTTA